MRASGIICSGSIVYDTLVYPFGCSAWGTTRLVESIEYHVGGNAANTARAMAIVGASVRLIGAVGNDRQADFVLDELQASGVSTDFVMRLEAPTATTVVLVERSRETGSFSTAWALVNRRSRNLSRLRPRSLRMRHITTLPACTSFRICGFMERRCCAAQRLQG